MGGRERSFLDLLAHFLRFELFDGEERQSELILFAKRLRHLSQKPFADGEALVGGQIRVGVAQVLLDPLGQLAALVGPRVAFVGEDHDAVVRFAADAPTDALGRVPHRVERQKVVLADEKLFPGKTKTKKNLSVIIHPLKKIERSLEKQVVYAGGKIWGKNGKKGRLQTKFFPRKKIFHPRKFLSFCPGNPNFILLRSKPPSAQENLWKSGCEKVGAENHAGKASDKIC